MTESTDRSERTLEASRLVGFTPKQNLEWLVDFAQRDFQSLDEQDPSFEDTASDLWAQWCVLVWGMEGSTFLQSDARLTVNEILDVQAIIFSALRERANGKPASIRLPAVVVTQGAAGRKIVEPLQRDRTTSFLSASATLLFEKSEPLKVAFCAYSKCPRGRDAGRLGELPRLFVQNRHSKYCSRTCSNNAASDRFLDNPKNKKRRLENRKHRRATKPAEHK